MPTANKPVQVPIILYLGQRDDPVLSKLILQICLPDRRNLNVTFGGNLNPSFPRPHWGDCGPSADAVKN